MCTIKRFLPALAVGLVLLVPLCIKAQEPTKIGQFQLNELKVKGFNLFQGIYDCAVVSKKKFIAFARDYTSGPSRHNLRSFLVKSNGTCKKSNLLLPDMDFLEAASAVWIEADLLTTPAAKGQGIVFVAYTVDPAPPYDYKIVVEAILVNARGKSLGRKKLKEFPVEKNQDLYDVSLAAAANDTKILLAFGGMYMTEKSGGFESQAVTMLSELDFDGEVIRENIPIDLPNSGEMMNVGFFRPMWTGKRWFTPACFTEYAKDPSTPADQEPSPSRNTLALVISGAGESAWVKTLMVEPENDETFASWRGYVDLSFLPHKPASSPAEEESFMLMVHHRAVFEDPNARKFDWYEHAYYLVTVHGYQGYLIGDPMNVKISDWKRTLKYDPSKSLDGSEDYISRVMYDENHNLVFTHSRSFSRYWRQNDEWQEQSENQNILYKLNPENGKVKILNRTDYVIDGDKVYLEPIIFNFSGALYIINNLYHGNSPWARTSYLTVF